MHAQTAFDTRSCPDAVAIVGMACRFPGGCNTLSKFWKLLTNGESAVSSIPPDRWNIQRFYDENRKKPGKMYVRKGCFIKEKIDAFDATFFNVSPREAAGMDPQQRFLLEVTWEAFEDAGIDVTLLSGTNTGVYIGGFALDGLINQMGSANRHNSGPHTAVSSTLTMLSNRLSFFFDFKGPSVSIDTACSSSLVGFHYACESILRKDCVVAIAGGANIMFRPEYPIAMCKSNLLAPDGRSKSFDEKADGYGRGEGAGVVVLKSLENALAEGHRIYAIVRATGINHDGRTDSITIPNAESQKQLIRNVIAKAGITPEQIQYVEAHGTGTATGDPIEVGSIGEVIGKARLNSPPCLVGSVKANIGHLEAASGIASVIKTALCLYHQKVPAVANLKHINPKIDCAGSGLHIPTRLGPMPKDNGRSIAGINAFGYGGTNAHAILESFRANKNIQSESEIIEKCHVLPISAHISESLDLMVQSYYDYWVQNPGIRIGDLCYSASKHRAHHTQRLAFCGWNRSDLLSQLKDYLDKNRRIPFSKGKAIQNTNVAPVFVFTGMGPQWWKMGRELLEQEPVFRQVAAGCDALFKEISGFSILDEMFKDEKRSRITETLIAQPANVLLQIALFEFLKSRGIVPSAVVGHSVGEIGAAYASGALSLHDAMAVAFHRSTIQKKAAGQGAMLAASLTEAEAWAMAQRFPGQISLAAVNSPSSVTLSGDRDSLETIAEQLVIKGIFHRFLRVEVPYHSHYMDALKDELRQVLKDLNPQEPSGRIYSTVTGAEVTRAPFDAAYWCDNVREPVFFAKAMNHLIDDGYRIFMEIGPHPVLSAAIKECMVKKGCSGRSIFTLHRKNPEIFSVHKAIGDLYAEGYEIPWEQYYRNQRFDAVELPHYQWHRSKHWSESPISIEDRLGSVAHPLVGTKMNLPQKTWHNELNRQNLPYLQEHVIEDAVVLPGASYVEMALSVHHQIFEKDGAVLKNLTFHQALVFSPDEDPQIFVTYDDKHQELAIFSTATRHDQNWRRHASGQISAITIAAKKSIDVQKLRHRIAHTVNPASLYAAMQNLGFQYGPCFRGIQKLWKRDNEVLAYIEGHPEQSVTTNGYFLHPTLLDACFQAMFTLILDKNDGQIFLPVRIDQFTFCQKPAKGFYAYGLIRDRTSTEIKGDIFLFNRDGETIAEVKGLTCKSIHKQVGFIETLKQSLYSYVWEKADPETAGPVHGNWLFLNNKDPKCLKILELLKLRCQSDVIALQPGSGFKKKREDCYTYNSENKAAMAKLLTALDLNRFYGVVYCPDFNPDIKNDPVGMAKSLDCFQTIQALLRHPGKKAPRIYLLTQALYAVEEIDQEIQVDQAMLAGIIRVACGEFPERKCSHIDMDKDAQEERIMDELLSGSDHDDVAFRGSQRYVHKLTRTPTDQLEKTRAATPALKVSDVRAFHLRNSSPPALVATRRIPPGAGEIEIELTAIEHEHNSSQNSENPREFVGHVIALGPKVTRFQIGDPVVGITAQKPGSHLTLDECANTFQMPSTADGVRYLTMQWPWMSVYQALNKIAHLRQGQVLLLFRGPDPYNRSVVIYARQTGAHLIGVIQNKKDQDYFESIGVSVCADITKDNFSDCIHQHTQNRGADICLSYEPLTDYHNFEFLADSGVLLSIQTLPNQVPFRLDIGINRNLACAFIDLHAIYRNHMEHFQALYTESMRHFDPSGYPPQDLSVTPLHEWITMSQKPNRSNGEKRVISLDHAGTLAVFSEKQADSKFHANGTYLITGGFGGFGSEIANWMATEGAGNIVLIGRNGANNSTARDLVRSLEKKGANVFAAACDITRYHEVKQLIDQIQFSMPPIKGVIHAAATLDDDFFLELNPERFLRVIKPKVLGAWHLHQCLGNTHLDFFHLFSSISSLIGNQRQVNYVAANAFLDTFAHFRRKKGMPCTSINWGVIGTGGMAEDDKVKRHLNAMGIAVIRIDEAMQFLRKVIEWAPVQIGFMKVDWARWQSYDPILASSPRFSRLVPRDGLVENSAAAHSMLNQLAEVSPEDRLEMIVLMLAELIAEALHFSSEKIDLDMPIAHLGIDSLLAAELQHAIQTTFGVEISTLELLKGVSTMTLAENILDKLGLEKATGITLLPDPVSQPGMHPLDHLSEKELDALIQQNIVSGAGRSIPREPVPEMVENK